MRTDGWPSGVEVGAEARALMDRGGSLSATAVVVSLVNERQSRKMPVRLALGSDALENIENVYKEGLQTLEAWADVSQKTDFV